MLLWKDLKTNLAPYAGDGSCDPTVVARELNLAVQRLMLSEQWKALTSTMRMAVIDTVFPMPYNVETLLGATIDGTPAKIYGTEYQFVSGGPGDLDAVTLTGAPQGLTDMGDDFATMFDVPLDREGYVLAAFCTQAADIGKVLHIQGHGIRNEELRETLPLTRWSGGVEGVIAGNWGSEVKVTANSFRHVGRVILPDPTFTGCVSLYAVYPSENQMYYLAKYHPSMRIPTFRRYRFTTGLNSDTGCATVLAHVKLKFVPCVDDYDVVPFESELAVLSMMQAIKAEKTNPAAGEPYVKLATSLLGKAQASKDIYRGRPILVGSVGMRGLNSMARRLGRF